MRTEGNHSRGEQLELAERVVSSGAQLPSERPTADAELEVMFVKAASAWLRWRERQRWGGQ